MGERGEAGLGSAVHNWWKDFYVWEQNDGFWSDIGKPSLRKRAEKYYSKK